MIFSGYVTNGLKQWTDRHCSGIGRGRQEATPRAKLSRRRFMPEAVLFVAIRLGQFGSHGRQTGGRADANIYIYISKCSSELKGKKDLLRSTSKPVSSETARSLESWMPTSRWPRCHQEDFLHEGARQQPASVLLRLNKESLRSQSLLLCKGGMGTH